MGFFDVITKPFVSMEHKIEEGGKKFVKVVKNHPIETAIGAAAVIGGAALIVGTGGLATPFVAEAEAATFTGLTGAATMEAAAEMSFLGVAEATEIGAVGTEVGTEIGAVGAEVGTEIGSETGAEIEMTEIGAETEAVEQPEIIEEIVDEPKEEFDVNKFIEEEFGADDVMVERTVQLDDIGFDYAALPEEVQSEVSPSVLDNIKNSVIQMAQKAQAGFNTAEEWAQGIAESIEANPITRGLNAVRKSAIVKGILGAITGIELIKGAKDILVDDKKKEKKDKKQSDKIKEILEKIKKLKELLSQDQSKMSDMQKQMTQQELDNQQKILEQEKQFHQELQAEQLKETHLEQKNAQLQQQIQQDEAKIAQEEQQITQMRNEVEDMKELIGESFLRPLDFNEMILLMNELEGDEIINFLARNRKDYDKLSNKEKKQVIELGKKKLNR